MQHLKVSGAVRPQSGR